MERCWIEEFGKSLFLEKFRGFKFEWCSRRYSSNQIAAAFVELYCSIPALFIGSWATLFYIYCTLGRLVNFLMEGSSYFFRLHLLHHAGKWNQIDFSLLFLLSNLNYDACSLDNFFSSSSFFSDYQHPWISGWVRGASGLQHNNSLHRRPCKAISRRYRYLPAVFDRILFEWHEKESMRRSTQR